MSTDRVLSRGTTREKRCTGPCGRTLSWDFYYASKKWPDGTMKSPQPKCRECHGAYRLEWQRRQWTENRAKAQERERRKRIRRKADPERHAAYLAYHREWDRARSVRDGHQPAPHRWLENRPMPQEWVAAVPVREAVRSSGVAFGEIAARAGWKDEGSVRRAVGKERMKVRTAVRILAAIDVLPAECNF